MYRIIALLISLSSLSFSESPPILETSNLRDFADLSEKQRKLIVTALTAAKDVANMPYKYAGNGPSDGGFDCSGAIYFILTKIDLKPARTSSDQYLWVKQHSKLNMIPNTATDITDPIFATLKPGDLLFWSGTYEPTDDRKVLITHVAMFLGYEKTDNHPVIISASDGRSYRGKKHNGFGIFDFKIPPAEAKARLVAFGTPPGLE
jgi:peptidoglycan DL-endopeptidase CwlO